MAAEVAKYKISFYLRIIGGLCWLGFRIHWYILDMTSLRKFNMTLAFT